MPEVYFFGYFFIERAFDYEKRPSCLYYKNKRSRRYCGAFNAFGISASLRALVL
jgi:hypothetical protein